MKKKIISQCTNCQTIYDVEVNICHTCHNEKLIHYHKQVLYNGRTYSKKEWMAKVSVFEVKGNYLNMKYFSTPLHPNLISQMYQQNIKSSTKTALIVPTILFFMTSIISFLLYKYFQWEIEDINTKLFLIFIAIFFLGITMGLLIMMVVFRYRCILTINQAHQIQYKKVPKKEIVKKIDQLKNIIEMKG